MKTSIILSLLFQFTMLEHTATNDLQFENLKGKVSSYVERTYSVKSSTPSISRGDLKSTVTYKFDDKGNAISSTKESARDTWNDTYVTKYGPNGIRKETEVYQGRHLNLKLRYNYKGILTERTLYDEKGYIEESASIKGNESKTYDENKNQTGLILNKYDEKGHEIETDRYNMNHILIEKHFYTYNKNGDAVESNGSTQQKQTVNYQSYDQYGNWTKAILYSKNEAVEIWERQISYRK